MASPTQSTTHPSGPSWTGKVRLADRVAGRENNFDLLRLLAAWAVVVSHSFALTGHHEPLSQFNTSLGNVGVLIFFAVSGLLIHRSWDFDPRPRDFWIKRGLRLLPALATVALLTAFMLGPAVTTRSLGDYFSQARTWIYPVRVTALFPFGATLPGVFEGNIFNGAVNGPLWSLPVEVFAYLLVCLLGLSGLLRRRWVVATIAAVGLVWATIWVQVTSPAVGAAYVLSAFALGAAAYTFRDRIILWWPVVVVLLGLSWAAGPTLLRAPVWTVTAVYGSYWFAYAVPPVLRFLTRFGDASYGMYIYAFPVQQTLAQAFGDRLTPLTLLLATTAIVWPLAVLSWRLIERRALQHKPSKSSSRPTT